MRHHVRGRATSLRRDASHITDTIRLCSRSTRAGDEMHSVLKPLDVRNDDEAQRDDARAVVGGESWSRQVAASLVEAAATAADGATRRLLRRQAAELLLPRDCVRIRRR